MNGEKIIDRDAEQEIFEDLIGLKNHARLLTICDEDGRGKSTLLSRLQYNCHWRYNSPASLIRLDEADKLDEFGLVLAIRDELAENFPDLAFDRFDELNHARMRFDMQPFERQRVAGHVDARNARVNGQAVVAAHIDTVVQHAEVVLPGVQRDRWPHSDMERTARRECVRAFFDDLRELCEGCEQPVVILFDAWDRCATTLQGFILRQILHPHCFDLEKRPAKLVFVLAGSDLPSFEDMLGQERYDQLVRSIRALSQWDVKHVKEFLEMHGFELSDQDVETLRRKINEGISLSGALTVAQVFSGKS